MSSSSLPSVPTTASRAEADFTRLFNLSLDLLCIAGLDGYFKRVNPSWVRVLGWSEAELLARPVAEFMHPEDRERTLAARAGLARGIPVRDLENRYLCKDGSYRWLSWQSVTEPGETTVFAVARDITERRQLDHEQVIMSKLESTGILAGGIAHDFNNLLTGLALSLDAIAFCQSAAEREHYLRQAQQTVNAAKSLTEQLIMFADGGAPVRKVLDLRSLLEQSVALTLSGSRLHAECRVAPDLWPVEADEAQIYQAMRNLLLNAREASSAGGAVRLLAENVPGRSDGAIADEVADRVRIHVIDEGAGIAPDILPKVFDPYFSTKQRGTQKGMGLGLTIARTVIRSVSGAITIDSQLGQGTCVTCYLPACGSKAKAAV